MQEKEIENYLRLEIEKLGGKLYKWVSPGNPGVPDRIAVLPYSKLVFIELKTDAGCLSKIQEKQISTLRQLGQNVVVIYGMEGACKLIETATELCKDCKLLAQVKANVGGFFVV